MITFQKLCAKQGINNRNKEQRRTDTKSKQHPNQNYEINIFFAGGGIITLISETIEVIMHDLGKPWKVRHVPKHKI